jgi:hypothetical protein
MSARGLLAASHLVLRIGSLLVPRQRRFDWLAEWQAELWQAKNALSGSAALQFACGALPDAWCLRLETLPTLNRNILSRGTPGRCLMATFVIACTGMLLCLMTPASRQALLAPDSTQSDTVFISAQGYRGLTTPTIRLSDYQEWEAGRKRLFSQFAFLIPAVKRVRFRRYDAQDLNIVCSDANIVDFLSLPASEKNRLRSAAERAPQVLVSDRFWRELNHGHKAPEPIIRIGSSVFPIAGVVPDLEKFVHGKADVLWMAGGQDLRWMKLRTTGYAIARLSAKNGTAVTDSGWWAMLMLRREGVVDQFDCISIAEVEMLPRRIFFYTLLLSLLALPATTPLRLGDYSVSSPQAAKHYRRWIFLAAKLLLGFTAVVGWSMVIAYSMFPIGSAVSLYLQVATSFVACLLVLRWVWRDQRRRCPECLHLLSSPARVGYASQSFLGWSGTEWICGRGHGVLQIPELPTSWLSIQRWLQFDSSWRSLFSGAYAELP